MSVRSPAVGMLFIAKLAQRRSPASAALLFLLLIDEIEGLIFLAVGVLLKRPDLFLQLQDVLFPSIVLLSGAVALIRNWRRKRAEVLASVETVDPSVLAERIGAPREPTPAVGPIPSVQAAIAQPMFKVHVSSGAMSQPIPLRLAAPQQMSAASAAESEYRRSIAALHARNN